MKGDRYLWQLRRSGRTLPYVWVSDFPLAYADTTDVSVVGDTPELLDLRFLLGTTVIVSGLDAGRVERIATACAAHAKRVISNTYAGRALVRVADTEGILIWQR